MILSLALATLIVGGAIAKIGVSPAGQFNLGSEGTATRMLNATMWNSVYNAFNLGWIVPIVVGVIILFALVTSVGKMEGGR